MPLTEQERLALTKVLKNKKTRNKLIVEDWLVLHNDVYERDILSDFGMIVLEFFMINRNW